MHRRHLARHLLILGLLLGSGAALAQGLGLGLGFDDLVPRGGKPGPPAVETFWLWNTHGTLIWNTHGSVLCNAC